MQKTMLKAKVFLVILLVSVFLAVLPMQLKSANVLLVQSGSTSASSIMISAPSTPTFQSGPTKAENRSEWTTDEAYSGSYSVLLAGGTQEYVDEDKYSAGRVVIPVDKPLADITGISFYYMISEDAEVTESQDFLTFAPDDETSGYLSPYVILHIKNDTKEHWIVSQTISLLEADKGEWLQFDSTATNLPYYGTLGAMKWHDKLWTDGDTVPDDSGWEELSFFQETYDDYTVKGVKVAMGEWSTSELQTAYVDEVAVGAILIADPQHGTVGTKVLVAGYDASPGRRVNIYWDEVRAWSGTRHTGYLGRTTADSVGDFKVEITVPEQTGGGAVHEIIAYDTKTEDTATVEFTIKPKVVVSSDTGAPEDTLEVEGTGFSKDADVDIYFDEDGDWPKIDPGERVATAKTDKFGSFAPEEFDVSDVDEGDYDIWAIDEEGYSAKDVFTVTAVIPKPVITLDPTKGRPGDEITIEGKHFTEEEDIEVTVTFNDEEVGTYYTEEDGSFEGTFLVPEVAAGDYTVTAKDEADLSAEADFEVVTRPKVLTVEIHPETLNLKSNGRWITCLIKPPANYDVEDIDVDTVVLCYGDEEVEVDRWNIEGNVLMVKFVRSEVAEMLAGAENEEVELTIKAKVNGKTFEGTDTTRVISPGKGKGPKS